MNKKIIIIISVILAVILIGGGIFYYLKFWKIKNQNNTSVVVEKASDFPKPTDDKNSEEKILIYQKTDNGNEIRQYDLSKKESRLIFTDRDEDLKINLIGGLAALKNEVLIYLGGDDSGKLAVINLDDGAKTIISESFAKPQVLAESNDGQTIIYSTTNPEINKSTIYQMARDGSNKRQLLESEKLITNLALSQNGDKIVYLTHLSDNKSTIETLDPNSLKNNQIYTSSNQILSLQYHLNDQIIFSEGMNGQIKTGRAMVVSSNGGSLKKIFETKKDFPLAVNVSSDFLDTAFILVDYKDKFDSTLSGEADFIKVGDESINEIGSGNLIIGWQL